MCLYIAMRRYLLAVSWRGSACVVYVVDSLFSAMASWYDEPIDRWETHYIRRLEHLEEYQVHSPLAVQRNLCIVFRA